MKNIKSIFPLYFIATATLMCIVSVTKAQAEIPVYKPSSPELYAEIILMDSIWEDSYNHCKIDVQEQIVSEDLELAIQMRVNLPIQLPFKSKSDLNQISPIVILAAERLRNRVCIQ